MKPNRQLLIAKPAKAGRKKTVPVSLDALDVFELEGTEEDIALVEEGLAIMARKQSVWTSVLEGWKRRAGILPVPVPAPVTASASSGGVESMTFPTLVNVYLNHEHSPYRKLSHASRRFYDGQIRRLLDGIGDTKLAELKLPAIMALYNSWTDNGTARISHGHAGISILRGLIYFGAVTLEDPECVRLAVILRKQKFKNVGARTAKITAAHVNLIRMKAHETDWHSIALYQALIFETKLKQKQILGEWVPLGERGESKVVTDGKKWLPGLLWSDIDENLIVTHKMRDGSIERTDLKNCPMVMEELDLIKGNRFGPVIVCDSTKLPWVGSYFRAIWRKLAAECEIPKEIRSTDAPDTSNDEPESDEDFEGNELMASEAGASDAIH